MYFKVQIDFEECFHLRDDSPNMEQKLGMQLKQ